MNRANLQQLAEDRVKDAEALLAAQRWAGAYHLAGYALECALKSCVLHYIEKTGIIFTDRKYLDNLPKCWTHDLVHLLQQSNLKVEFDMECRTNSTLEGYWGVAKDWTEVSRYQLDMGKADAEALFEAITNEPDGVLSWIRQRW